jgi:hypothetical protein
MLAGASWTSGMAHSDRVKNTGEAIGEVLGSELREADARRRHGSVPRIRCTRRDGFGIDAENPKYGPGDRAGLRGSLPRDRAAANRTRGRCDHGAVFCAGDRRRGPVFIESSGRFLPRAATEATRLGSPSSPTPHHERRRCAATASAGGCRTVHLGALRSGHGSAAFRPTSVRTKRKGCEEASGGGGGAQACGVAAPALGERRAVRTVSLGCSPAHRSVVLEEEKEV